MDNPILWQALLGIFSIAAIVFAILGGKVSRVPTVLTVVGLFLSIVTFFILAALTLKTHASWRELHRKNEAELAKLEAKHTELQVGSAERAKAGEVPTDLQPLDAAPDAGQGDAEQPADGNAATENAEGKTPATKGDPAVGPVAPEDHAAAGGLTGHMAELFAIPGEVLRKGNRQFRRELSVVREARGKAWFGDGKLTLPMTGLPTADVTITQPDAAQIDANMPIYVFQDDRPGMFLGEFKVTTKADKTLKLTLVETPTPDQAKRLAGKDGKWILRSIMPVDTHDAFVGLSKEDLMKMLPQAATGLTDAAAYEALISERLRDGQTATKDDVATGRVFFKMKFTKEGEVEFKDSKGLDAKRKVNAEDEVLVSAEKAQELVDKYGAERLEPKDGIYLRPLRNYENSMRSLGLRIRNLLDRSAQITAQTIAVEAAIKDANEVRMVSLDKEGANLKADKAKMEFDDEVKKYLDELNQQQTDLLAALKKQYTENNRLAAELTQLQLDMAKRIDEQAAAQPQTDLIRAARK